MTLHPCLYRCEGLPTASTSHRPNFGAPMHSSSAADPVVDHISRNGSLLLLDRMRSLSTQIKSATFMGCSRTTKSAICLNKHYSLPLSLCLLLLSSRANDKPHTPHNQLYASTNAVLFSSLYTCYCFNPGQWQTPLLDKSVISLLPVLIGSPPATHTPASVRNQNCANRNGMAQGEVYT